jgi:hypothetical protein
MNKLSVNPPSNSTENALIAVAEVVAKLPGTFPTTFLLKEFLKEVGRKAGEVVGEKFAEYLLKKSDQDIIKPEQKVSITSHLISSFPEDWQADLESQKERWIKQKYLSKTIRYLILKHLLHMIWVYIQIKIENIWLPKSSSTKEIE